MKTMSLAKLKEGGQEGELVESKHMIKEALLSNPTLLSNIIVNLQQKNSELPQTVQENMEIFQETDESPGKIGPEDQQSLPEPREEKAAQQDFQFEEVEQSVNQQSAYNKKKVNKPSKTVQRAIRSKKSKQNVSNPKQQGRDKKKAGEERPINNKNKLDQDEQQSQKQSQSPKPAANKAFAKKIARTKRSSASTQKQTRTASSQQKASRIDQQAVQEEVQQKQIKKPKKPMPKQKEQPPMRQLQFIVEIKQDRELKKMLPKQKLNKVGRAANQTKQHQIIDFAIKIQLLSKKEYQDFQQKQAKTKRKGKQQQKGQRQRFGGIANEREEEVNHFINQQKKINLGSLSLLEIVQVLKDQGFLDESIYDKFAANHTSYDINDFLKKFSSGQLATFDYKLIPFTLLDHRRLSELVSNLRQESYFIGEILSLNKQVHNFLVSLYDLQAEKYYKLYKNIDEISKIEWWSELIEANKAAVMETCKRNLQNRKNVDVKEHIATPKSGAGVKGKPYKRRRA